MNQDLECYVLDMFQQDIQNQVGYNNIHFLIETKLIQ